MPGLSDCIGLFHQTGQGGQVKPEVGHNDVGVAASPAEDRQPFESPILQRRVAGLGGITALVIEILPLRGTNGEISHQAQGAILKA